MVSIPTEFLRASKLTDKELLLEIAVMLFQKEKLTLGQAAKLAEMSQHSFQMLLGSREISIHYDVDDFRDDLDTIKRMDL